MKVIIYYGAIIVAMLGLVLWMISFANDRDAECKQKGGILVKTQGHGFVCMDALIRK